MTGSGVPAFGPDAMPAFMAEMLRQQREMMAMNQQLIATMLRRMDLEEERRNKAEEKVHEAAEAAQKAAEAARTRDPFDLSTASSTVGAASAPSAGFGGNRAEKYLPSLPLIDHLGMGKGRMKEVETWHSFMETLSSWLALQEEAFVRELQLCIPVKSEIKQVDLNAETAARSSKLFYYLTQSLAKWDRGLELLRSCSKRQGQSACGYEVIRTITSQYSIVSRMEAVFVREQALKLYQHVSHLKRPTDLIRHLEDSFSKAEAKLSNFPELKLSEADRCSVLLQSLTAGVREYVVLHGSSSDWEALRKTLTYYEEQLRLCEKANTPKGKGKGEKGKGDQGKPKGKGRGDKTPKGGNTPRGSEKGKGDKDGKGKKNKKKKKGQTGKGRSLSEGGEPESEYPPATVMALRFAVPSTSEEALPEPSVSRGRVLIPSGVPTRVVKPSCSAEVVPRPRRPEGSLECEDKGSESMGAVGSRAIARGDVAHVCKALETTAGDLWLVDSGATCHIVSDRHLSGFRVVKKHDRTANLFNASGGSISVTGVVNLEVHFGDVFLRLEEVLVADVGFNVLSPWTGAERGWKTYLAKNGSRLYKGNKKSIKLLGAQRAWWAVSGNKKGKSKRQPRGGVGDMELDALEKCTTGAPPGLCSDLGSGPPGPRSILKGKKEGFEERGARNCLRDTPFSFMLRGFRSDLPLERDLPRTPETLEEVSGNRALRNFARKVFGMIFSMVFAMFYVMFSGMSFGMVFGMIGMSLGMFFGMIFGMIRSNFGMFCSMFGSMFCSMFGNTFLNMFGWMVQEVVMIQCGGAASILEVAALRGSRFISSLAGLVCLLLLGPWAFPRVAVAATSPATNVARCAAEMPACGESSSIATITAGLASTVGLANAGWRNTTGWGRLMFKIFLGGRFWSSRKIDLEGLSSPGRRGSVPRVEPRVKSCILLGEDRQILKAFRGPLVERKRTELIGSLYQRYRGPPRKQHVTRNVPCHVGMLCMLLFGMIFGVHASAASFSGPTCVDNDGCKHGRGRVHPNFDRRGFTPGLSTKRAPWTGNGTRGLSCVGEPSFQPRRWFWAGCFECSAQEQSSGTSSARSLADSGCGSLSGGRRRLGSRMARGNSFEKASFSWGCFWIRGACLWNSWECSAGEPFPSSWRVILSRTALDQSHDGGSGPPLEGSGGGRACERSPSRQRATAIAFPLFWDPRECGRHVGFRVGGRQYSWASFAGFGKPFWIVWCSDRTSWDSSPFRVWGSNASSCQGDGGLSGGSGGTFPEASHGRGCYTNNGRRNSLEPVAGQSSCWEGSCRAWAEDFGLRGKQAHSGVHASAFGGVRVPIEGPEESSRPHGCHALYYPCRILLPELPAGTSGLQRPSWRAGGKDASATSQRVGKGGGPSLEDFGGLGGLPNGRCEEKGRREKGSAGGSSLLKIGHGKGGGLGICPFALDVRLFVGRGSLRSSIGSRGDEPCRRSAGWEDVEVSRGYGGLLFEGLAGVIQHWPSGRSRASLLRGPGGDLGAPFAQESGGGVNGTVGGPGDGHCRRVQSPAGSEPIGVPGLWSSSSSSCPEALPAANATPCSGGGSFGSIERASNGNGSSNGIGSFNGNGPNRAREEFQVAGSFADPSLDIFSFGSGGDLREPYRECLTGFPNSGRRSKGSDPFGPRGPRRGEQRAGVIASRSEFLVKFPELTSGRSSGESSSMENFADVSFREHVLQHVCQHVLMHVWHGSCSEHVSWHDGCCAVQTLSRNTKQKARNLKKPQAQNLKKPRAQNLKKPQAQNLREPSSFRSGSPGVDLGILVGILMVHSLLSGLLLWVFPGSFGCSERWCQVKGVVGGTLCYQVVAVATLGFALGTVGFELRFPGNSALSE